MQSHNNRAQSTLEYLIILTLIIIVIVIGVRHFAPQNSNEGVGKLVDSAAQMITDATNKLP
jgi:uncharacterized protein (UPF0333 family)